jgi:hypothetical protein
MSSPFITSYVVIWIVVVFQGLIVLALLRELTELRQKLEAVGFQQDARLPIGTLAPDFTAVDVRSKKTVGLHTLKGTGGAILFLTPHCGVCKDLANSLQTPSLDGLPPIIVFCQGGDSTCARVFERLDPKAYCVHQHAEEIATRYRVTGSPTVVLVDGEQKIRGYGHPEHLSNLKELLAHASDMQPATTKVETDAQPVILGSTVTQ